MTERPTIRWFAGIVGDPDGVRELTQAELDAMNKAEKIFVNVGELPAGIGETMVNFGMEAWFVSFDKDAGKMIYRKLDPADMVRADEEGEGSPDDGSD